MAPGLRRSLEEADYRLPPGVVRSLANQVSSSGLPSSRVATERSDNGIHMVDVGEHPAARDAAATRSVVPNRKETREYRKKSRVWSVDASHPKGGYWYALKVPEEDHGNWGTYNNWYCRCPSCTNANRIHCYNKAQARKAMGGDNDSDDPQL
ncbi:hypothetical protein [Nocardia phage P3.1]|nr:hypothetical protein [Nocardia phage P3.1]